MFLFVGKQLLKKKKEGRKAHCCSNACARGDRMSLAFHGLVQIVHGSCVARSSESVTRHVGRWVPACVLGVLSKFPIGCKFNLSSSARSRPLSRLFWSPLP